VSRAEGYSLFFYGSLRAHEVRVAVLGKDFCSEQMQDACLEGYQPRCVVGAHYPMLVEQRGGLSIGLLVQNISDEAMRLLDDFEGVHYHRVLVDVRISGGLHRAEIYRPDATLTAGDVWHYERWRLKDMASFFADDFALSGVNVPRPLPVKSVDR
jgi:gamma-glutamylcyclotransferase (GGCT)/AIG2-like uncharacterized protein YtfP